MGRQPPGQLQLHRLLLNLVLSGQLLKSGSHPEACLPCLHQGHAPCTLLPLSDSSGRRPCVSLRCSLPQCQHHSCPGYMQQSWPSHALGLEVQIMNAARLCDALQYQACPSFLSALLQQKMLWRKHRLNLVTTSRDIGNYEALLSRKSVKQAVAEGDGMAVSPAEVRHSCPPGRATKYSQRLLLMLDSTACMHALLASCLTIPRVQPPVQAPFQACCAQPAVLLVQLVTGSICRACNMGACQPFLFSRQIFPVHKLLVAHHELAATQWVCRPMYPVACDCWPCCSLLHRSSR